MNKICNVAECSSGGRLARGMCNKHYLRWKKYGDPNFVTKVITKDFSEALKTRTERDKDSGCLLWLAVLSEDGYAIHQGRERREHGTKYAHRIVWERYTGEKIPVGLEVDHLCHTRNCLEVSHMRLATREEQVRNTKGLRKDNSSGYQGVTLHKPSGKFMANINFRGVRHYLGLYDTAELASVAVESRRAELWGTTPTYVEVSK